MTSVMRAMTTRGPSVLLTLNDHGSQLLMISAMMTTLRMVMNSTPSHLKHVVSYPTKANNIKSLNTTFMLVQHAVHHQSPVDATWMVAKSVIFSMHFWKHAKQHVAHFIIIFVTAFLSPPAFFIDAIYIANSTLIKATTATMNDPTITDPIF